MTRQNLALMDRDIGQMIGRPLQEAMAHGIENDMIYGGLLAGQSAVQGLNALAVTVQNCLVGSRRVTWDGRVYKYSKSIGACYTGRLSGTIQDKAINTASQSIAAGSSTLKIDAQTFAANAFEGGFVIMFGNPGSVPNDANCPVRRITASSYCNGTTLELTLDQPLEYSLTTPYCEVFYSPYIALATLCSAHTSFEGVAGTYVDVAAKFFWEQTWGECWIAPQVASFEGGLHRDCYARHDGSIQDLANADATYDTNKQRVGFIVSYGLTCGPLVMLQISR